MPVKEKKWSPSSWRGFEVLQQPSYDDKTLLVEVENKLSKSPPLIYFEEAKKLKKQLDQVAKRKAFLLQAGDCAESFAEFNESNLQEYFRVILQMTAALMYGAQKPVVKVGRIAGQFAKPRSSDYETIDGKEIPSYRGDMVNSIEANFESRKADPQNLIDAYKQSGVTLNYLRSLASGGFASLDKVYNWIQDFAAHTSKNSEIAQILSDIKKSSSFFKACGFDLTANTEYNSADFFTSHEALLLNYEESLTRFNKIDGSFYDCSAHMLWIGERTRNLDGAHVEFFRGIANPIASKVGPSITAEELVDLVKVLNPKNDIGKLTLISRMGSDNIDKILPKLVKKLQDEKLNVIWSCDPMHGNTEKSSNGYKTRKFSNILLEVKKFFEIHQKLDSYAGGIHIEMTGQDVTECLGGITEITEQNLKDRYNTHCDPRLNGTQSLELAFLIAEKMQESS